MKIIRCPGCGGDSVYAASNPFRPFCSVRCKNHDFGAWASERYAVPERPGPAEDAELDPEPTPPRSRTPRANQ